MSYAFCRTCGEDSDMKAPTLDEVRFNNWCCPRCGLQHELSNEDRIERLAAFIEELAEKLS